MSPPSARAVGGTGEKSIRMRSYVRYSCDTERVDASADLRNVSFNAKVRILSPTWQSGQQWSVPLTHITANRQTPAS